MFEDAEVELNKDGYLVVKKNGIPVHWWVYKWTYGDKPKGWHIHHIDANKVNNSPKNLIALPAKMHRTIHQLDPLPTRQTLEAWLRIMAENNGERRDKKALRRNRRRRKRNKLKGASKAKKAPRPKGPRTPKAVFREMIASQIESVKIKRF
jgi:hypothetical protein